MRQGKRLVHEGAVVQTTGRSSPFVWRPGEPHRRADRIEPGVSVFPGRVQRLDGAVARLQPLSNSAIVSGAAHTPRWTGRGSSHRPGCRPRADTAPPAGWRSRCARAPGTSYRTALASEHSLAPFPGDPRDVRAKRSPERAPSIRRRPGVGVAAHVARSIISDAQVEARAFVFG